MHKKMLVCLLVFLPFLAMSCYTQHHTIGSGRHGGDEIIVHQWYTLCGTIPLEEKDGGKIAGTDRCEIITKFEPLDCLITLGGIGGIFISRKTIIIKK